MTFNRSFPCYSNSYESKHLQNDRNSKSCPLWACGHKQAFFNSDEFMMLIEVNTIRVQKRQQKNVPFTQNGHKSQKSTQKTSFSHDSEHSRPVYKCKMSVCVHVCVCGGGGLTVIPSASYSSCSDFRVSSMKSCCSFSLQQLMQNCSKLHKKEKIIILRLMFFSTKTLTISKIHYLMLYHNFYKHVAKI